jgi:hypothetical protein
LTDTTTARYGFTVVSLDGSGEAANALNANRRAFISSQFLIPGLPLPEEYVDDLKTAWSAPILSYMTGSPEGGGATTVTRAMDDKYPSRTRATELWTAQYLNGGAKQEKQRGFLWLDFLDDDGDWFSDMGVEFAGQEPQAWIEAQRAAVTSRGLTEKELLNGTTRYGVKLSLLYGPSWQTDLPLEIMHIGSNDPEVFSRDFAEWEKDHADSKYGRLFTRLGYDINAKMIGQPGHSDTPNKPPTQGEYLMERIHGNYTRRLKALGSEALKRMERPLSSIPRMDTNVDLMQLLPGGPKKASTLSDPNTRYYNQAIREMNLRAASFERLK